MLRAKGSIDFVAFYPRRGLVFLWKFFYLRSRENQSRADLLVTLVSEYGDRVASCQQSSRRLFSPFRVRINQENLLGSRRGETFTQLFMQYFNANFCGKTQ